MIRLVIGPLVDHAVMVGSGHPYADAYDNHYSKPYKDVVHSTLRKSPGPSRLTGGSLNNGGHMIGPKV